MKSKKRIIKLALFLTNPDLYKVTEEEQKIFDQYKNEKDKFLFMPRGIWEKKAFDFFNNINDPKRPEYWSNQKLEYDIKENKKVNDLIKDMTWEQTLDFIFNRCLHYLKTNPFKPSYITDKYYLLATCGNSRPDQYEFNFSEFSYVVGNKLLEQYDIVSYYKESLGYGHFAEAHIAENVNISINNKKEMFTICYYPCVQTDEGFHTELYEIGKQIKKDIQKYCKKSKYCTTPIDELLKEIEL